MNRAIIYLRVSTIHQKESGAGLKSQLTLCKHIAARLKIKDKLFFQDAGVSGFLAIEDRPGLSSALIELKKGDIFIVASRDRIARDTIIAIQVERIIEKCGAQLICASPSNHTLNASYSLAHRRRADIKAELIRERIQIQTTKSLARRKKMFKRVGTIPYGYKIKRGSNLMQIYKKEQQVINRVKSLRDQGTSLRDISKQLTHEGYSSRTKKPFGVTQVVNILKENCPILPSKIMFDRNAPYGYVFINGAREIHTAEFKVIDLIKQLHTQGYSLRAMVYTINHLNYRNRACNEFQLTQVARIKKRLLLP